MKKTYRFWALAVLCVLLNLGLLQSRAAADVKATVRITAEAPDPNPVTPGDPPARVQLQGTVSLSGKDSTNKECVIDSGSESWLWSLDMNTLQFSTDGTNFAAATPSPANPTFSYSPPTSPTDTQHSISDHPILFVATTAATATTPGTTPGYWKITVKAAVTFTSTNCGPGAADNTREIVIAVGKVPAEDFDLSVSPDPVSVAQGTGGTTQVTVTSKNGFSGDVTVSLSVASPGVMGEFYDPKPDYAVPGPGAATTVVHLDSGGSGGSDTLTLTLCVGPTAVLGNHTLTVQGVSGKISHTKDFTLTVITKTVRTSTKSIYTASDFGNTGIGRKVETTDGGYAGLSATVTLPTPDSAHGSIVLCDNKGFSGDAAYIYTGGRDEHHIEVDAGFQLGHIGNAGWKTIMGVPGGQEMDTLKGMSKIGDTALSSAASLQFMAPGYQFAKDPGLDPAVVDPKTLKVNDHFVLMHTNGHFYCYKSPWSTAYSINIKRLNTIGQNHDYITDHDKGKGDGPGDGFYVSGSSLRGGAWSDVTLYKTGSTAGLPWTATVPTKEGSYPGCPYVKWHTITPYTKEDSIALYTLPPASVTCP